MKKNFEKLENGKIRLTVTLDKEEFEKYNKEGVKKVQEYVQIDGFRKGNARESYSTKIR